MGKEDVVVVIVVVVVVIVLVVLVLAVRLEEDAAGGISTNLGAPQCCLSHNSKSALTPVFPMGAKGRGPVV